MESRCQNKVTFLFITLLIVCAGCRKNIRHITPYTLDEQEKSLFQEGDIILRKGEGTLSHFITDYLADTLSVSHCGILIKNRNTWEVIHSLAKCVSDQDGVQTCSLDQFTAESIPHSIRVVRYKADSLHVMAKQALYYLHIHKPFDINFNMEDTSAFFCSQLPLHILKYHLHSDLEIGDKAPLFSLFLNEKYFRIVYSPDRK